MATIRVSQALDELILKTQDNPTDPSRYTREQYLVFLNMALRKCWNKHRHMFWGQGEFADVSLEGNIELASTNYLTHIVALAFKEAEIPNEPGTRPEVAMAAADQDRYG